MLEDNTAVCVRKVLEITRCLVFLCFLLDFGPYKLEGNPESCLNSNDFKSFYKMFSYFANTATFHLSLLGVFRVTSLRRGAMKGGCIHSSTIQYYSIGKFDRKNLLTW